MVPAIVESQDIGAGVFHDFFLAYCFAGAEPLQLRSYTPSQQMRSWARNATRSGQECGSADVEFREEFLVADKVCVLAREFGLGTWRNLLRNEA